jgi:Leucine-rich repeat (LRR) protein
MIQSIIGTSFKSTSPFNFDITANWSLTTPQVVDEASFKTFLESGQDGNSEQSNLTNVVITDFLLEDNRLRCNLIATGSDFRLGYVEVTNVNAIGNIVGLQYLDLVYNQIVTFNPTIALPDSLQNLGLYNNNIVTFNPTLALPSGLQSLELYNNQIVTFNPSIALPSGLQVLYLSGNQIVTFDPTIPLPNSLTNFSLYGNQIVTFNPSIPLPTTLGSMPLNDNQMTTTGYTNSEPWANAMSVIPGRGTAYFQGNVDPVTGTNLETILIAKGWNVYHHL